MTDTKAVRKRIKDSGLLLSFVAREMGIAVPTLQRKLENKYEFKISEVEALEKILNLTKDERDSYFFKSEVEK